MTYDFQGRPTEQIVAAATVPLTPTPLSLLAAETPVTDPKVAAKTVTT